jgi:hypothetical protein
MFDSLMRIGKTLTGIPRHPLRVCKVNADLTTGADKNSQDLPQFEVTAISEKFAATGHPAAAWNLVTQCCGNSRPDGLL